MEFTSHTLSYGVWNRCLDRESVDNVPWACLERVQNIVRIISVFSTLCPRLTSLWSNSAYGADPTKADLPPINLRCTPALTDPYKTRFRFCPLGQWEYSGEDTHTGSLKVSLGYWQGKSPLKIRGASFRKSAPSIHPSISAIYSTEDDSNCSAENAIFFTCSADDMLDLFCRKCDQFSWQRTSTRIWKVSTRTVFCSRTTCCFLIWTKCRVPYTGSLVPVGQN